MRLTLVPLGPLPQGFLRDLETLVTSAVPWEVDTGAPAGPCEEQHGEAPVDARRAIVCLPPGSVHRLQTGITESDLSLPGFEYVFGFALPDEHRAVVSLHRLHGATEDRDGRDAVLLVRARKEILHEAGHLLGLGHCPNLSCVMHYSQTLRDTDIKGHLFCARCAQQLSRLPEE